MRADLDQWQRHRKHQEMVFEWLKKWLKVDGRSLVNGLKQSVLLLVFKKLDIRLVLWPTCRSLASQDILATKASNRSSILRLQDH